ncbi:MAG: hypothetical protein Salg2KO_02060 [Salibacteraceae bacterium]
MHFNAIVSKPRHVFALAKGLLVRLGAAAQQKGRNQWEQQELFDGNHSDVFHFMWDFYANHPLP